MAIHNQQLATMPAKFPPVVKGPAEIPVSHLKGVGVKRAAQLERLGIRTILDLIYLMPHRWENRGELLGVEDLYSLTDRLPKRVLVRGHLTGTFERRPGPRLHLLTVRLSGNDGRQVEAVWFNQPYIKEALLKGEEVVTISAAPVIRNGKLQLQSPQLETGEIKKYLPVYPLTDGLTQGWLRTLIKSACNEYLQFIRDPLPGYITEAEGLVPLQQALETVHNPENLDAADAALARISFEKAFIYQVMIQSGRMQRFKGVGAPLRNGNGERSKLLDSLPFSLTGDQRQALLEIDRDLEAPYPMRRLLQGEVGSGKTILACLAALKAVATGYQAVLMSPTEILARQSRDMFEELLSPLGINVGLLISQMRTSEKKQVMQELAAGKPAVTVGTHALIQESVEFARLGLVIIDEQHRFGVLQRLSLTSKGINPHVLVMTATPIPRTLVMALYGELEQSVIRELPPGRGRTATYLASEAGRERVYGHILKEVEQGRQAYIVCPAIEENMEADLTAAEEMFKRLKNGIFSGKRLGLLHGRMPAPHKEEVMSAFRSGMLDILVSTTVVEVGVDVPNATIMMVENADRFGLAQLHQLRGRVGRGRYDAVCILMCDKASKQSEKRLKAFSQTNDGFKIAELDYMLRGPGNPCGFEQHGFETARLIAGLEEDLLERAIDSAAKVLERDPNLQKSIHQGLKQSIIPDIQIGY